MCGGMRHVFLLPRQMHTEGVWVCSTFRVSDHNGLSMVEVDVLCMRFSLFSMVSQKRELNTMLTSQMPQNKRATRYDIANHFCECAGFNADFRRKYPSETQRKRFLKAYVEAARPQALRDASVSGC